MTISAFRVNIDNDDRGEHSVKYFSGLHDASVFYGSYKKSSEERLQLVSIIDSILISER